MEKPQEVILYDAKHMFPKDGHKIGLHMGGLPLANVSEEEVLKLEDMFATLILKGMVAKILHTEYDVKVKDYDNLILILESTNADSNLFDYISQELHELIGDKLNKYRTGGNYIEIVVKEDYLIAITIY